jgi:hypothetical protein
MEFTKKTDEKDDAGIESGASSTVNSAFNTPIIRNRGTHQQATVCGECTIIEDGDPEASKAPIDRILLPTDLVEIKEDDDQLYIIGTKDGKVTKIAGLEHAKNMKVTHACAILLAFTVTHSVSYYRRSFYDRVCYPRSRASRNRTSLKSWNYMTTTSK